jgi:hypothetical protein
MLIDEFINSLIELTYEAGLDLTEKVSDCYKATELTNYLINIS